MGSTINYDLNIPSGSDQVNILTQITPNFETIDEVMKANEDAGIHVATELFSNNIHALTRTKGDAPAMRFTATSNYTAGDTFTVDGVQVTALAPNGATLPDNAYVIGCEVFAILKGMHLTVWAGSRATDSEKLNGEAASFYATKDEVDNAQELAEGAATLAQNALDSIPTFSESEVGAGSATRLMKYGKMRTLTIRGSSFGSLKNVVLPSSDRPDFNVGGVFMGVSTTNLFSTCEGILNATTGKITINSFVPNTTTGAVVSDSTSVYGTLTWMVP